MLVETSRTEIKNDKFSLIKLKSKEDFCCDEIKDFDLLRYTV